MTQLPEGARRIGYARVSTEDQNLDLQLKALREYGCETIYQEKVSGAAQKRPQLDLAIMDLREGDVLVVWRLDRFARSLQQLFRRLTVLEKKGAAFMSLTEGFDMTTASGRFMLHVAAAFAEFERQLIATRTSAGMQAKMATGWKPGREPVLQGEALERARELRLAGASADQIVQAMQDEFEITVSRQTVYNWTSAPIEAKK